MEIKNVKAKKYKFLKKRNEERTFGWSPSKDDARSLQPTTASTNPTPLLVLLPLGFFPGKNWFHSNDVKEDDDVGANEDDRETNNENKEIDVNDSFT